MNRRTGIFRKRILFAGLLAPMLAVAVGCGADASDGPTAGASTDDIREFIEANPQYADSSDADSTQTGDSDKLSGSKSEPSEPTLELGN